MNILNIKNDIILFKDETLKSLRNIENQLLEKIKLKEIETNSKIADFDSKLDKFQEINKRMYESILKQQINLENIKNLYEFKSKIEARMVSIDVKLSNYISDLINIRNKYDKLFSDNLTVPGIIGTSCKYKTISQHINDNINIIEEIKDEKELIKKEVDELKTRNDLLVKYLNISIDGSISTCKLYTDTKDIEMKNYFKDKFEDFNNIIYKVKNEIEDNVLKTQEIRNSINNDIKNIKDDITYLINEKDKQNEIIKNAIKNCQNNEIIKKIDEIKKNFKELKTNMEKK